jgi:RNA polymerase sigma-54 factor
MKPMVLRDIAEEIEMHESTVSRVTNNKYISTPRGVFELKYFFSQGISSHSGAGDLSQEAIKYKIKSLIEKETDVKSVLSDDKLVIALKLEGVDIARRTVAKYREALKIPSSAVRKREKRSMI